MHGVIFIGRFEARGRLVAGEWERPDDRFYRFIDGLKVLPHVLISTAVLNLNILYVVRFGVISSRGLFYELG